jgi:hypothetical protein
LLEIATRLKSMPLGVGHRTPRFMDIAGMVGEALHEAEFERLPKCDNDERWGFMKAKLSM